MNIWVLRFTHKHGDDTRLFISEQVARNDLEEWCRQWWNREGVPGSPEGMQQDAVIAAYFDYVNDREWYDLSSCPLDTTLPVSDRKKRASLAVDMHHAVLGNEAGDSPAVKLFHLIWTALDYADSENLDMSSIQAETQEEWSQAT